jgi:hypothetical protein
METAATLAVARAYEVERAAVLLRIDDLISGEHDLFDPFTQDALRVMAETSALAMDATIEAVTATLS